MRAAALMVLLGAALLALPGRAATPRPAPAAEPVAIQFARFFGSCEAEFGSVTDPARATGECGIVTALTNRFNAREQGSIVVRPQTIEHRAYYGSIGARIINRDVPAVAILHSSVLSDFVRRGLVEPLDAGFAEVGVAVDDFTPQARRAVQVGGRTYALPFDTHSWLWHVNLNLLRQAGLLHPDGRPVVPASEDELLRQARHFKSVTGKPYFVLLTVNDAPAFARTLMTLVQQQGASLFPDDSVHIRLQSAAALRAIALMRQLYREGLASQGHDYAAGIQAFVGGQGAVMINGTWLLGDLDAESRRPGRPLAGGYAALAFPQLYAQPGAWADNHILVMLRGGTRTAAERRAALRFLRFLYDENVAWARTGQLPTRRSVITSAPFLALPQRAAVAPLAEIGDALPLAVARQSRVNTAIGDALTAIVVHGAPAAATLEGAERSIRRMLERDSQFSARP